MAWTEEEFGGAALGNARLTKRLVRLADDLSSQAHRMRRRRRRINREYREVMRFVPQCILLCGLRQLQKDGLTIILTTDYMNEAEWLCGRIILMGHGRILADRRPEALVRERIEPHVLEGFC